MITHPISPTPVLLSVLGGSPQILTETLYGIYKRNQPMPEKIVVITTTRGLEALEKANMFDQHGKVAEFCKEYDLPLIEFSHADVQVIKDQNNEPLEDARTPEQHSAIADFICEVVRELSSKTIQSDLVSIEHLIKVGLVTAAQQKDAVKELLTSQLQHATGFKEIKTKTPKKVIHFYSEFEKYTIHASIAGGRKSMTFLLGYAMSLFGRRHDKLSHVLVDERVENHRDFFYPSREANIQTSTKDNNEKIDFSQMNVELADIPFITFRDNLPEVVFEKSKTYSDTVNLAQDLNAEPRLVLDMKMNKYGDFLFPITCGSITFSIRAKDMAYMLACAKWRVEGKLIVSDDDNPELIEEFSVTVLSYYMSLLSRRPCLFKTIEEFIIASQNELDFVDTNFDYCFGKKSITLVTNDNTGEETPYDQLEFAKLSLVKQKPIMLSKFGGLCGLKFAGTKAFSKYHSDLKATLQKELGSKLAALYIPSPQQRFVKKEGNTKKSVMGYGLNIKPENIAVLNNFVDKQ